MLSRNLAQRFSVFVDAGLIPVVPTLWQLQQGSAEMMPYVVAPDAGDRQRYAGARLGHPLLRTPIVLSQIGRDHLQIGHGLFCSSAASYFAHLMFVYHEGMPTYDLQLVQTCPDGLAAFRRYITAIDSAATPQHARQRRLIDLIIPNASQYRQWFIEPGGWIDRAARFDYPDTTDIAAFLRPEFMSLVGFANYCAERFPATVDDLPLYRIPLHLARLALTKFANQRRASR